jgi:V8-like Glu-specific endopeptidase
MKSSILFFIFFLTTNISFGQTNIDSTLVCDVSFKDSSFNNTHAGSGFLVAYKNKIYACTAKHVLFFAKTDNMKTISFGNELTSWIFRSKTNKNIAVLTGKLINENIDETIEMPPKGDWLIFEITGEIPKNIAVYTLRDSSLKKNEEVYFLGYPYKSKLPVKIHGNFIGFTANNNLRLDIPKGTYNGCSGGPVLDKNGELIGLVSMGYFNQKENKMIFEPASINYFKTIINNYTKS